MGEAKATLAREQDQEKQQQRERERDQRGTQRYLYYSNPSYNKWQQQHYINHQLSYKVQFKYKAIALSNIYKQGLDLVCPMGQCEYIHYVPVFDTPL